MAFGGAWEAQGDPEEVLRGLGPLGPDLDLDSSICAGARARGRMGAQARGRAGGQARAPRRARGADGLGAQTGSEPRQVFGEFAANGPKACTQRPKIGSEGPKKPRKCAVSDRA